MVAQNLGQHRDVVGQGVLGENLVDAVIKRYAPSQEGQMLGESPARVGVGIEKPHAVPCEPVDSRRQVFPVAARNGHHSPSLCVIWIDVTPAVCSMAMFKKATSGPTFRLPPMTVSK